MFQIADWSQRKREIAAAFRQATPLPAEADSDFYTAFLRQIGVANKQDVEVLISFLNDVIMEARRGERPATPLETFLDWVKIEQTYEE